MASRPPMVLMDPAKVEALMVTVPRPKGLGSTSAEILPRLQGLCDIFNVANVGRAKSPTEVVATVSEMKRPDDACDFDMRSICSYEHASKSYALASALELQL